jgi:iduronate 2-sulfatase
MRAILATALMLIVQSIAVASDRPNVLLICVDDLKPSLGCYGDEVALSPAIDGLAARGVRFELAFCNQAICSPSRNALMTSLRPQTLGIYDLETNFRTARPDAITIGQTLQLAGYHAAGLGKIFHQGHGNHNDKATWSTPHWNPKSAPLYADPKNQKSLKPDQKGTVRGPATENFDTTDETYIDGQVAIEAMKRLDAAAKNPNQPFFLAVGFARPHLPFVAPTKYWDLYNPSKLPMPAVKAPPEGAPSYAPTQFGELRNYSDIGPDREISAELTRHLIHGYYAATSYMDAQLGKVIKHLDSLELANNTIIILWGDHGWHLGDHGMWCKHTNFEQAARIPLIVVDPRRSDRGPTQALVETVDIYPTICELTGTPIPHGLDGQSFAKVLEDRSQPARPYITHVYPRGDKLGVALRDARYRMVQWQSFEGKVYHHELYDYQTDPLETVNLAAQLPDVMKTFQNFIDSHPLPVKPTNYSKASNSQSNFDRAAAFKTRDTDGDGFLDYEEFMLNQPDPEAAPKRFPKFDKNGDQKLSVDEYVHP